MAGRQEDDHQQGEEWKSVGEVECEKREGGWRMCGQPKRFGFGLKSDLFLNATER